MTKGENQLVAAATATATNANAIIPTNRSPNDCNVQIIGKERIVPHYKRGKVLGKGGFGEVFLCVDWNSGKQYALKTIPKAKLKNRRLQQRVRLAEWCCCNLVPFGGCDTNIMSFFYTKTGARRSQDSPFAKTQTHL